MPLTLERLANKYFGSRIIATRGMEGEGPNNLQEILDLAKSTNPNVELKDIEIYVSRDETPVFLVKNSNR